MSSVCEELKDLLVGLLKRFLHAGVKIRSRREGVLGFVILSRKELRISVELLIEKCAGISP